MNYPDAKNHLNVSLAKSGIRILAAAALAFDAVTYAGVGFVLAEILGVVEELV